MNRRVALGLHLAAFAVGLPALAGSDFWDWRLLRGLLLPAVSTIFLVYLVLFLALEPWRGANPPGR